MVGVENREEGKGLNLLDFGEYGKEYKFYSNDKKKALYIFMPIPDIA